MPRSRTWTRKQKVTAILAADMTNPKAAAEATGIPRTTIIGWLERPEFDTLRHNAREHIADEAMVVARLAWQALGDAIRGGRIQPRDLITAAGVATDKAQLLAGEPTARTENKSITDGLDDHERDLLNDAIRAELARRSDTRSAELAVELAESRGSETS